jgi:hypothetical protein
VDKPTYFYLQGVSQSMEIRDSEFRFPVTLPNFIAKVMLTDPGCKARKK